MPSGYDTAETAGIAPSFRQWFDVESCVGADLINFLRFAQVAHPVLWLGVVGFVSTAALGCWYTPLFFILSRARNEFTAGLGGILLTLAVHIWLLQLVPAVTMNASFIYPAILNPLAPLPLMWTSPLLVLLPLVVAVHIVLWIVLPVVIVRRLARKAVTR